MIRDEHAHTYQLGPALISLGRAAANNVRIQEAALPILKNLSYNTRDLHCGAIRKVLLAYQEPKYIDYYLNNILDRPESFPQISRGALASELKTIREMGIAVSHGEYVHDAVGIGAPIFGIEGRVSASVGIIAPYSRVADDTHLHHLEEQVKHSAAELSYYMGHTFQKNC